MLANELKLKLSDAYKRIRTLEFEIQEKVSHINMESHSELEKRLAVAECKVSKLEEILLSNWELINFLNQKYGKLIGKDSSVDLGTINGIKTQRYVEQINKKLNGK